VTLKFALFAPAVVVDPFSPGAKLTLMVQLAPTASVVGLRGQLLVCVNVSELRPVSDMPVIAIGDGPALVSVTGWDVLVVRSG